MKQVAFIASLFGVADYAEQESKMLRYYRAGIIAAGCMVIVGIFAVAQKPDDVTLDREEAKSAFAYLNQIRAKPADFGKEIGADLKEVSSRPALAWNDAR